MPVYQAGQTAGRGFVRCICRNSDGQFGTSWLTVFSGHDTTVPKFSQLFEIEGSLWRHLLKYCIAIPPRAALRHFAAPTVPPIVEVGYLSR